MRDLTKGNELRLIFFFAIPMLLGNVIQQLYNFVDMIIVGKVVGTEAINAVGNSIQVIWVLISLAVGISVGIGVVISQFYGAKDLKKLKVAIDTMFVFVFICSLILTAVGILFSDDLFRLMNLPEEVLPYATEYFNIYVSGFVLMFGFYATSAILRGLGDSLTPLWFLIASVVLNVILDILFVVQWGWGISGAAWATVISQGVAFIGGALYLRYKGSIINLQFRTFNFDWSIFKTSFRIGLPSGLQTSFVAIGGIILYSIVNDFGNETGAAYAGALRIDSLASLPAMQFAAALSTFVGQNVGAGKFDRVRRGLKVTWFMSSAVSIFVTLIVITFSGSLMRLFTTDPEVIRIGQSYLYIVCAFYVIFGSMFITNGVLRGAGATIIPMFITLVSIWILRIPISYLLSREWSGLGSDGIWWGIPVAWTFGAIASFLYYKFGNWKKYAAVKTTPVED